MKRLAIFYHARLTGGNPPVSPEARTIMAEQMDLLVSSGLYEAANEIVIGLNQAPGVFVNDVLPPGVRLVEHGERAESELPTLHYLQQWLPGHEDWYVCYFHAKGARHGTDRLNVMWRGCMERAVLHNWRRCIRALDTGADTAGAHWLTPEQFPTLVKSPFWGGNFWWAKGSFLRELPPLPQQPKCREDFFIAENWIGAGLRPTVTDYRPHWPGLADCTKGATAYV